MWRRHTRGACGERCKYTGVVVVGHDWKNSVTQHFVRFCTENGVWIELRTCHRLMHGGGG